MGKPKFLIWKVGQRTKTVRSPEGVPIQKEQKRYSIRVQVTYKDGFDGQRTKTVRSREGVPIQKEQNRHSVRAQVTIKTVLSDRETLMVVINLHFYSLNCIY